MNHTYQTIFKIIIIIVTVMIVLKISLIFLWPFLASVFLSLLLEPIVKLLIHKGFSRKTGVIVAYLLALSALIVGSYILSKYIFAQLAAFLQNAVSILQFIAGKYNFIPLDKIDYNSLSNATRKILLTYKDGILDTVLNTFNGFMNLVVIVMCSLFISLDFQQLTTFISTLLPISIFSLLNRIYEKLNKIIKLELQLVLLTTLQTVLGLYILGINNALTIGIICGILDLLPIVGTAIVFIPLIIYEFSIGKSIIGIGLILLFILLQVIREILKVRLVGKKLDIHPLITLLCLYYGLYIYGIPGLVLGPILVVVIIELYHEYAGRSSFTKL